MATSNKPHPAGSSLSRPPELSAAPTSSETIARLEEELRDREAALREYERMLGLIQHIASIGTWAWDVATDTITWTDELYRHHGLEPQSRKITFEGFLQFQHFDDRGMVEAVVRRALETRQPFAFDHRIVWADGTQHWLHGRGDVVVDDDGNVIRMVGTSQNITARKQAESELRKQAHIVDTISDAVIVTNVDGDVIDWNPAAERIFGYPKAEIVGRPLHLLSAAEDVPELVRKLRDAFKQHGRWAGELPYIRKDRSYGVADVIVAVQRDANGRASSIISVSRDVTERKRLEAQLQQSQKMEAVGRLAGGIAHDFNNMLTAVKAYSEFLLEDLDPADARRTDVQEIAKAADRAASLTRQLLAFSRKQVLQPRIVDPAALLRGMESLLRRLIGENIAMEFRIAEGAGRVLADPTQLEQVILNLAVNARDAMPHGGTLSFALETARVTDFEWHGHAYDVAPGEYVVITVQDTGTGIDPEVLEHIFDPFFTTKGEGEGTGLGLATVYGVVKQSGGYIWVDTSRSGTSFRIYLPRTEPHPGTIAESAHTGAGAAAPTGTTVLLVEDERALRTMTQRILEQEGYVVYSASDGVEAMEILKHVERPPDLLLTDVVMPLMGGRELAQRLAVTHPATIVVFMSGYTGDDEIQDGVAADGRHFLGKPFSPAQLIERLAAVSPRTPRSARIRG